MVHDAPPLPPPLDIRVHLVGNGRAGSGCRVGVTNDGPPGVLAYLAALPRRALSGDLDSYYLRRLLAELKASSLGAICALAFDRPCRGESEERSSDGAFYVPNRFVFSLAKREPKAIPGVSIHPERKDALEELDRCIEEGAALATAAPLEQRVDLSDRRAGPFWDRLASAGMPLLLLLTGGRDEASGEPRCLLGPLERGVAVIASYRGGDRTALEERYLPELEKLALRFPRLYFETSALVAPSSSNALVRCLVGPLRDRLVHGSSYPSPLLTSPAWLSRFMSFMEAWTLTKLPNLLERDMEVKRALGIPTESFHRGWELLRCTPQVALLRGGG